MKAAVSPQDLAVEKKYTTFLYDRPLERNITHNHTGLYTPNDTGSYPIPFGQLATIAQIKHSLQQIEAVMEGYAQFVVDYTPEYGKRFYEAILYAFTAPFLWEIREKASLNPEDGNDIPNFLILGASAGSGKSTLLRIINQLTWGTDKSMIDFGTIYPMNANQRKAKTVQALESYMKQGSTYPVLIDEIEPYFFQQHQYSRRLIVDTMNQLVNSPKPVAPLMGLPTTIRALPCNGKRPGGPTICNWIRSLTGKRKRRPLNTFLGSAKIWITFCLKTSWSGWPAY